MSLDKNNFDMENLDNIIYLNDEDGMETAFEFLDLIVFKGISYVVLLPIDGDEVVILQVKCSDNRDEEVYVGVENQSDLSAVFSIFKEKFKDEFNFVD